MLFCLPWEFLTRTASKIARAPTNSITKQKSFCVCAAMAIDRARGVRRQLARRHKLNKTRWKMKSQCMRATSQTFSLHARAQESAAPSNFPPSFWPCWGWVRAVERKTLNAPRLRSNKKHKFAENERRARATVSTSLLSPFLRLWRFSNACSAFSSLREA